MSQPPRDFESFRVGETAELEHVITENDVGSFVELTGDDNPLHADEQYAAQTLFKKRVVHGMLTASFISTMIGTKLPGTGALWYEQNLRFLSPVRIGERIRVEARIIQKSETQRILVMTTDVLGEGNRKVIEGTAKVKVIRPQEKKSRNDMTCAKSDLGAVIVTGGSRGIGAAIVRELAMAGHPVLVNYRSGKEQAEAVVQDIVDHKGQAMAFKADVADPHAVQEMVEAAHATFGTLAGAVSNASGGIETVDFFELGWDAIQAHMDTQVRGAVNLAQAIFPRLVESGGGSFVTIGSSVLENVPPVKQIPYTVAKGAVWTLTKCLAAEFGPASVRVNCVSPGMTTTDLIADFPDKSKMLNKMQTPLRQLAAPEDIASGVAFLMSDKARHITGQNLKICGGLVMA